MGEFEIFKEALEKIGAQLEIHNWDFDDHTEDLIEDCTHRVSFWFINGQLDWIDNDSDD